jgi:hypothetical protein
MHFLIAEHKHQSAYPGILALQSALVLVFRHILL